jgi:methionine synthase II (cobalamin-independent)
MAPYTPNLSTTGIGSLPFTQGQQAVDFLLGAGLDIPFWPQLPKRCLFEQMVPQYTEGMPGVVLDMAAEVARYDSSLKYEQLATFLAQFMEEDPGLFAISPAYAEGLYAFLTTARGRSRGAVKGHVTGPVTFATGISEPGRQMLYADPDLRDASVKLLSRKAQWQVEQLRACGGPVIIFVDEPVLAAFGSSAYIGISEADVIDLEKEIFDAIRTAGGLGGIHVCGNSDWSVIIRTGLDIVNFDGYNYGPKLAIYAAEVHAFLERGGCIAWGMVPTTPDDLRMETRDALVQRFRANVEALKAKGVPESLILERSLLTPSCGCGSLSIEETRRVFSLLREVRDTLRSR